MEHEFVRFDDVALAVTVVRVNYPAPSQAQARPSNRIAFRASESGKT